MIFNRALLKVSLACPRIDHIISANKYSRHTQVKMPTGKFWRPIAANIECSTKLSVDCDTDKRVIYVGVAIQ